MLNMMKGGKGKIKDKGKFSNFASGKADVMKR